MTNGEHSKPVESRTEEKAISRVWVWWEGREPRLGFTKPLPRHNAVEYMRVLSREEVEKLAAGEDGVDMTQLLNSHLRTIEGQRRHIAQLQEQLAAELKWRRDNSND